MLFFIYIFPLTGVLLAAIVVKYLLQFTFKIIGWRKGLTLTLDGRLGSILLLICTAVAAGILYWYPDYVARRNAAPDDRFGFFFVGAFPHYMLGAGLCGFAVVKLVTSVVRARRGLSDVVLLVCGALLALIGFSPFLMEVRFWFK